MKSFDAHQGPDRTAIGINPVTAPPLIAYVAAWVLMSCLALGISLAIGPTLTRTFFYDDTPGMVVHKAHLISRRLVPGEPLRYNMVYSKRADCYGNQGYGEVTYFLWDYNLDELPNGVPWRTQLSASRYSRAKPGDYLRLKKPSQIELPILEAGQYAFQWKARYVCARSWRAQVTDGPILTFTVIDGASSGKQPLKPQQVPGLRMPFEALRREDVFASE